MSLSGFVQRLHAAIDAKRSVLVAGIDPTLERLPQSMLREAELAGGSQGEIACRALTAFGEALVEAVAPYAVGVKPQLAYFEQYGAHGLLACERIAARAKAAGLLVIADGKRNDIGSTAEAYAEAYLGESSAMTTDALTVNPYLGGDGIEPFIERCRRFGKGIFVLVRTSNPSAGDFQDLVSQGRAVYRHVAEAVARWGRTDAGFGPVGAVVGATYPRQLSELRQVMPNAVFLVPGFGAQGGTADDVVGAFDPQTGYGAIVNSSRQIMYAYQGNETMTPQEAQAQAAMQARDALNAALRRAGRLPQSFVAHDGRP